MGEGGIGGVGCNHIIVKNLIPGQNFGEQFLHLNIFVPDKIVLCGIVC